MSRYFRPYPPMNIHTSQPISLSDAHALVSQYISQAERDRSLHPNAILTDDGPTKSLSGGIDNHGSSLVWHNMHRIEAGLRGEFLADAPPPPVAEDDDDDVVPATQITTQTQGKKRKAGWQEPDEYWRGQREVVGEVGKRGPEVKQGEELGKDMGLVAGEAEGKAEERVKVDKGGKVDKAERKKMKKERLKKEKKVRAKEREEANAAA